MSSSIGASRSIICRNTLSRGIRRPRFQAPRKSYSLPIRTITTIPQSETPESVQAALFKSSAHPMPTKEIAKARREEPLERKPEQEPLPSQQLSKSLQLPKRGTVPLAPVAHAVDTETDPSIPTLLPLLAAQPPHYITIHIHAKPFLVTAGDKITLPFRIGGVRPGDVLRLNRASLVGSRDYTLKSGFVAARSRDDAALGRAPRRETWVDERLFRCRAVVLGEEVEPVRFKVKTKQRQRHVRRVRSQHRYTVLRIAELSVFGPEVLEQAAEGVNAQQEQEQKEG